MRRRGRLLPTPHPAPTGTRPEAPGTPPTVEMHCEHLTIGLGLADGAIVLHLAGDLDRRTRPALLRIVRRAVRSSSGEVVVDCAAIASHDDAGIDALASLRHLPGVRSFRLRRLPPGLARRIATAGLSGRLGIGPEAPEPVEAGVPIGYSPAGPAS